MRFPLRILLALSFAAAAASAQADLARFDAVRDTIRQILQAQNLPSITVAVAKGNTILWEEGFGFANREKQIRATPTIMYSLASISKPFTATGMMVLAERGKLDIDHPANEYLGASKLRVYEGSASSITLRRILSHSAGLPLHYQFFYDGGPPQLSDDDAITHYGFSAYAPGSAYFYSNLGFGIIGHIDELVSGKNYETFMRDEVFGPLGLRNTTVSSGRDLGDRAAVRYDNDLSVLPPYVFDHMGASAVWSSAHDLVRFGMFHVGATLPEQRQIISVAARERMQHPEAPETSPGNSYGLGWATLENDNGYRRISHTGGMPGVSTTLNLYPSERVAIVVLINRGGAASMGRIANMIAAVVLPEYASNRALAQARNAGGRGTPPSRATTFAPIAGTWRGTALVERDTLPFVIDVGTDGGIRARLGTQSETALNAATFSNNMLSGRFDYPLRAPDATPASERTRVVASPTLLLRGDRMTGWISSVTQQGMTAYGAVSYYAELTRAPAPARHLP